MERPYWKYFARPNNEICNNITYREYYEKYNICNLSNSLIRRNTYIDKLGNCIIKRNTPIITRIHHLTMEHGELYFY